MGCATQTPTRTDITWLKLYINISFFRRQFGEAKLWLDLATIGQNEANVDNEGSMMAIGSYLRRRLYNMMSRLTTIMHLLNFGNNYQYFFKLQSLQPRCLFRLEPKPREDSLGLSSLWTQKMAMDLYSSLNKTCTIFSFQFKLLISFRSRLQ